MALIETLVPTADAYVSSGTSAIDGTGFTTPNLYQNVLPSDDSTWLFVSGVNNSGGITFNCTDLSGADSVNNVSIKIRARADADNVNGYSYCVVLMRIGSTFYYGPRNNITVNWATYTTDLVTNPSTGLIWTQAEINATEFGVEWGVAGFQSGDETIEGYVSKLSVDVNYASAETVPPTPIPPPGEPASSDVVDPETLTFYPQRWVGTYDQTKTFPSPSSGGVFYFDSSGTITELTCPDGVTGISAKTSFARWIRGTQRRLYMNGGHTDNIAILEDDTVVRINMPELGETLVESASPGAGEVGVQIAPGPGLTGTVVVYLRTIASATTRRGPLSNGITLTLADQQISFTSLPTTFSDTTVDKLDVVIALDGDFPRSYNTFALAASYTTTGNEADFGAADTSELAAFPVCTMNAIYHDRLALAGDVDNKEKFYLSLNGELELYGGVNFSTKNGEPITGMYVVRDTLVIQTADSHYALQGYDGDDFRLTILSPNIGGLGHHTVTVTDDLAFFPSRNGWYMTDGASLTPIGVDEFSQTWANEQHWKLFTDSRFGFNIHDAENRLIKYKTPSGTKFSPNAGIVSANGDGLEWIIDYGDIVTGTGKVEVYFDTCAGSPYTEPTASAMMRDTDGEVRLYTAHASGDVAIDNVYGMNDLTHAPEFVWHSPQLEIAKPGDDADCAAVVKLWMYLMNEDVPIEWTLFAGNSYDYQSQPILGRSGGRTVSGTVAIAADSISNAVRVYRDRIFVDVDKSAGSTVSVLIKKPKTSSSAPHEAYFGSPLRADGMPFLAPNFSIRGWGVSFKSWGEETRSLRSYQTP